MLQYKKNNRKIFTLMLLLKDHLNIIPKISINFYPNPKVNKNIYDIESKK